MQLEEIMEEIDIKIAGSMGKKREGLLEAGEIIRKCLSCENSEEIARSSRDTDFRRAIEILDKLSFFGGQRAGRELWNDKPREVQDEDIASFNWNIEYLRDLIRKHMNDGWIPAKKKPAEDGFYVATMSGSLVDQEEPFVGLAEFEDGEWVDGDNVIAWSPLPEPYRQEGIINEKD